MKPIALVACAAALAGCVSANPQIPVPVSAQLARICQHEPLAHGIFLAATNAGYIRSSLVQRERAAHQTVTRICANPPTDAAAALGAAASAYAAVLAAQALAQREI
jgi:hypothetical protein